MTDRRPEPLLELRERFREAAAREMTPSAPRVRRRRRRALVAGLAAAGATGGIAVATQLISVGSPRADQSQKTKRYDVPNGAGLIAVTAPDANRALPWGVLVYRASGGDRCATVGHVRGAELGEIRDGAFRPLPQDSGGACGDIARGPFFADLRHLDGRSLLFGRARQDVVSMQASHGARVRRTSTGPGGAFLFVFDAGLGVSEIDLVGLGAGGKPIR